MHGMRDWHRGYICRASEHLSTNIVNLCGQRARCPHFWHKGGRHEVHDIKPDYVHGSIRRARAAVQVAAQHTTSGTNGQIAFSRQIDPDTTGIFIANPDGSSEQQVPLPSDNKVEGGATWSQDGSRLLISHTLRFDDAGNCCLPFRPAILKPDGSDFTLLEIPDGPFDMDCTVWLSQ